MDAFFDEHVSTMEKERYLLTFFLSVLIFMPTFFYPLFSRLMKIEMLDEIEEWKMLSQHYCISWALKNCHDTDYFSENFTSARGKS